MARHLKWWVAAGLLTGVASAGSVGNDVDLNDKGCAGPDGGEGEACLTGVDESDDAALSFRQLRAIGRHESQLAAVAQTKAASDAFQPGLPGGWGEADDLMAQATSADTLEESAMVGSQGWRASCARYRCGTPYKKYHHCQCNPSCKAHGNCCSDYSSKCEAHHHHHAPAPAPKPLPPAPPPAHHLIPAARSNIMTLYHMTGAQVGPLIIKNGFRPGFRGWCGGGIYFAKTAEATRTKAIGPESHQGYLIEAQVDVGVVKHMSRTCDRSLNGMKVWAADFDSVNFDPGDGDEYIVYAPDQVLSVKHIPVPW